ncbi:MAG: hypothetical protein D6698_12770 [Gammaproteobacteria bacterium]|nr:MAG: hypothetical protein D6698_12770 [Gammaproteobacteria bacterium]
MTVRKKLDWYNLAVGIGIVWVILSLISLGWVEKRKELTSGVQAIDQADSGVFFLATGSNFFILDDQGNIAIQTPIKTLGFSGKITAIRAISENLILVADQNEGTLKRCHPWIAKCEYFLSKNNNKKDIFYSDFTFDIDPEHQLIYIRDDLTGNIDTFTFDGTFVSSSEKTDTKSPIIERVLAQLGRYLPETSVASENDEMIVPDNQTLMEQDKVIGDTALLSSEKHWPYHVSQTPDRRFWIRADANKVLNLLRFQTTDSSQNKDEPISFSALNQYFTLFKKGKYSLLSVDYDGNILGSFGGIEFQNHLAASEKQHKSLQTLSHALIVEIGLSLLVVLALSMVRKKYKKLALRAWAQNLVGHDLSISSSVRPDKTVRDSNSKESEEVDLPNVVWIRPIRKNQVRNEKIFLIIKVAILVCAGFSIFSGYTQSGLSESMLLLLMVGLLILTHLTEYYVLSQKSSHGEIGTDGENIWLRDHLGKTVMAHPNEVRFTDRAISAGGITIILSESGEHGGKNQLFPIAALMQHVFPLLSKANKVSRVRMGLNMLITRHPRVWPPVSTTLAGVVIMALLGLYTASI